MPQIMQNLLCRRWELTSCQEPENADELKLECSQSPQESEYILTEAGAVLR